MIAITEYRLNDLKRKAQAATPGEWTHYRAPLRQGAKVIVNEVQVAGVEPVVRWSGFDGMSKEPAKVAADAAYIAAANPAVILALVDLVQRALVPQVVLDVDALANEIRRVDGNHLMGAGALAEALMPFISHHALRSQSQDSVQEKAAECRSPEAPSPFMIMCKKFRHSPKTHSVPACLSNCPCDQVASPAVAAAAARWEAFRKAVVEEDDVFLDLMMDALANEHKLTAEQWDAAIDAAIALHSNSQVALPGRVFANDGSQPEDDAHLQCPACAGSGHVEDLTAAARDVLVERGRQQKVEGWTPEHDDANAPMAMALAGASYVLSAAGRGSLNGCPSILWPWSKQWWKPTSPRHDLVKAGALIQAEIERLDRAALGQRAEEGDKA